MHLTILLLGLAFRCFLLQKTENRYAIQFGDELTETKGTKYIFLSIEHKAKGMKNQ